MGSCAVCDSAVPVLLFIWLNVGFTQVVPTQSQWYQRINIYNFYLGLYSWRKVCRRVAYPAVMNLAPRVLLTKLILGPKKKYVGLG